MKHLRLLGFFSLLFCLSFECPQKVDLIAGIGEHVAYPRGSTAAEYGFYIYLPENYQAKDHFPILVFLHGSGESGDSKPDATVLDRVLFHGPPKLIENQTWDPPEEMVVVSPQAHRYGWRPQDVEHFLLFLIENYKIDESRIYLSGLSMGGHGTYSYLAYTGEKSRVAAAVPICGGGSTKKAKEIGNTPVWAFHGDRDMVVLVTSSIDIIEAINKNNPIHRAKLTIYPNATHDSWSATYNGSGMGTEDRNYDPFDIDIYTWMLQHRK